MAGDGMLVLFAGVPVGTRAAARPVAGLPDGAQYTGTSGSRIADQALVIEKTLAGQLEPRARSPRSAGSRQRKRACARSSRVVSRQDRHLPRAAGSAADSDRELSVHPEVGGGARRRGRVDVEAEALLFSQHLGPAPGP